MPASRSDDDSHGLKWLVSQLDARDKVVDEETARQLFARADLTPDEVAPYIEHRKDFYARRCVARRETYEILVLTWAPGQGSVAHDHSGSLCALRVVQGTLTERLFESGLDGLVREAAGTQLIAGQTLVDPGVVVHSLSNSSDSGEVLVTVHLYSPPLPEIRRYAVVTTAPEPVFLRAANPAARVITIIGGGFTGTMTVANILSQLSPSSPPIHLVLIDRQPAMGEGIAYRTNDSRHLLNVPVEKNERLARSS